MKKRMVLALVLVLALLCLACSNDADDGASSSESDQDDQSVSVAETSTESSAESSSRADETSTESDTSSETSTESEASGTTTSAESTSSETSTGTESSATSSDTSTSSKPAENSENSKPAESVDTSSGSGNPSQTAHKHNYVKSIGKEETCTEDGYMVYTCSCGDSYKGEVLPATGHFLTESITKEPTETERGTMRYRCSNRGCDYEETREIYSWNELARVVEERVLYWINKYRAEEGAPTLTMSEKLTELNEVRCEQSLQGGEHKGHNLDDIAKACETVKVGSFCDYVYHASDGTVVQPHWDPHSGGQEAWIGRSYWDETAVGDANAESRIDDRAKNIVDAFRASAGHWVYVGGKGARYKDFVYVGIGIGPQNCYVTVCDYNPDEKGYEHITMDENGNFCHEWVKD